MFSSQKPFRLGLVINPYAGIGGALALKGSDGKDIRDRALAMGAEKLANHKASLALQELQALHDALEIITVSGEMGGDVASALGYQPQCVYSPAQAQTEATDTRLGVEAILQAGVDLLLFAGGDGTARDVCSVLTLETPALGIPAGCKIHSGVYAITPRSAGKVVAMLVRGELVTLTDAEVKDIDEDKFRRGQVQARHFGEMQVPEQLQYVQAVKMGGRESDELVLADIAAEIIDDMQDNPDISYIMGSGSTVDSIMQELGLDNTLLGVDIVADQSLVASDVTAAQLEHYLQANKAKLVVTLIGGQGHLFGRGNQQLSPQVIRSVGRENILVVATKTKLQGLEGRPLLCDSGDIQLDDELSGLTPVITGYRDRVLYPLTGGA